jgi:hypothetical protein
MLSPSRIIASAAVGGLVLLGSCASALAQIVAASAPVAASATLDKSLGKSLTPAIPVSNLASVAPGSIHGTVLDDRGLPIAGAMVSAVGAISAFAVTDRNGRFEIRTLSPGPYLVRAHLNGFIASRGQLVDVRSSVQSASAIALRRARSSSGTPTTVLAAGLDAPVSPGDSSGDAPAGVAGTSVISPAPPSSPATGEDHEDIAWRLRHLRRGILRDVTVPDSVLAGDTPPDTSIFAPVTMLGHAVGSPARLATNLFAAAPFSGQVNLLTTGTFDAPQQMFSDNFSRGVAYLALGAPVGDHADWAARAALTQGDIASWIIAGDYTTRAPATHRYDLGLSYSTQRYPGSNIAAMCGVAEVGHSAGSVYGFDTFTITPAITLTYGAGYARYDYLNDRALVSPRAAVTVEPIGHMRVSAMASHRALAPGAEEFLPRVDSPVWLPPQRTFSALLPDEVLQAERTDHLEIGLERDISAATLSFRAYRQRVSDQLVTVFGSDATAQSQSRQASPIGHYLIGNAGNVDASGLSAGVRANIAHRVRGSVEYSLTKARWNSIADDRYLLVLAPSAMRQMPQKIHDLSTSIETDVPETSTRVLVLYRVSNGFAHPLGAGPQQSGVSALGTSDRPSLLDSRFDVQLHQALPFMDFSAAKWEALLAVRNFFRETTPEQSVYDELLVVRPPTRIVGGLTLKF